MREATGLVRRIELAIPSAAEPVVIGFKRTGAWSIYFGADPVYQFDADHRLRRAFAKGLLWRTQGTTLARIHHERTESETLLVRYDLPLNELKSLLSEIQQRLTEFLSAWEMDQVHCLRREPIDDEIEPHALNALRQALSDGIQLAPTIKGKR